MSYFSVVDSRIQQEESLDLMKEVLSLLNNCNPSNQAVVVTTIIQWLQSSPSSILLLPCVRSASRCLASHKHMVQIIEECIQVYFVGGKLSLKKLVLVLYNWTSTLRQCVC